MNPLRRYWFRFGPSSEHTILKVGCGITAFDYEDALNILHEEVLVGKPDLHVVEVCEDIDVSTLDKNHILPNMGLVIVRGVWFPQGFE